MQKDDSFANLLAAHHAVLCERLQYFIKSLPIPLRDDVLRAFKEPGKIFAVQNDSKSASLPGIWALITLLVAQGINPDINSHLAGDVAVAIEIFICGLDLIDDIEDSDQTAIVQALGPARVLNVGIALLMSAQKVLLSLASEAVDPSFVLSLLNALGASFLKSVNGQHIDILLENTQFSNMSEADSMKMIDLKSGSLMSLAMKLGALCAGAEEEICDKYAECGRLLGIAYQLDNDSHDLYDLMYNKEEIETQTSSQKPIKTDLIREKKTFPIVIASTQGNKLEVSEDKGKAIHEGMVTSWGVSLLYRERALECLQDLEKRNLASPLLRLALQL
jgi:geranylgeranyl pyrophosphate synthase